MGQRPPGAVYLTRLRIKMHSCDRPPPGPAKAGGETHECIFIATARSASPHLVSPTRHRMFARGGARGEVGWRPKPSFW